MKLSYQSKIFLSALFFLLASGCLIVFLIMPAADNIRNIEQKTADQTAQVEKDYAEGQSLKKVADNLKIIEPRLGELEKALIKKDKVSDFASSLEETALKNGVTLEDTTLGAETPFSDYYFKIPLTLRSNGNFKSQIDFLIGLESLGYYINFKTLELTTAAPGQVPSSGVGKILTMRVLADTYWQN
jgi:Tfp pilus assembly protein PilO